MFITLHVVRTISPNSHSLQDLMPMPEVPLEEPLLRAGDIDATEVYPVILMIRRVRHNNKFA